MGLSYIPSRSLPNLNAVHVPDRVDDAAVRRRLLGEHGIEIGAGLGPFKGKAWRIGLMGHSSTRRNVTAVLAALETILATLGADLDRGAALAAAGEIYEAEDK
jgi:alanine-glyoxylate transaminase/serine-glyoxylate transaminase/serine-pyruvate transaminase